MTTTTNFGPQYLLLLALCFMSNLISSAPSQAAPTKLQRIDRHALVTRHNVVLTTANPQEQLQVGNGAFAMGLDPTGLQTFYGNTLSDWGWHSNPLPAGTRVEDFRLKQYDAQGRKVGYATDQTGQTGLYQWLRQNPHRFNLGRLSLRLLHRDGSSATLGDIKNIDQRLDLWSGIVTSHFSFDDEPVTVETCVHPQSDTVAVRLESKLVSQGRLSVALAFPYAAPNEAGADWTHPQSHSTAMTTSAQRADFARTLDETRYNVSLAWTGNSQITQESPHLYNLPSQPGQNSLEVSCRFNSNTDASPVPSSKATQSASAKSWQQFWMQGGAIDLSGSTDPRWMELERRIVLSQYLLAVQEAGPLPPQESGLWGNSGGWNGKFHLEMHLWHGAHYALWNRWPLFARSLDWYPKALPGAYERAKQQGYQGARWPKMTGPDGLDSPSGTGPLLIWQQVNPIFYAELDYRLHPTRATLEKWRPLIEATADFMASLPTRNPATGQYDLDSPLKTVPENTEPLQTRNPTFELSYWRFGLRIAQQWRTRLGLPRQPQWDEVSSHLAPLPQAEGLYLQQEGMTDTYTKMNWEHPSLIGILGLLPGDGVDPVVMHSTVSKVFTEWHWDRVWGWDFPMMAMAAARNGEPEMAVDTLLMDSPRNHFLANGASTGGPFPYFPSNGGLLYAVALMAAGWDGAPATHAPGFPTNGQWNVRFEDLNRAP